MAEGARVSARGGIRASGGVLKASRADGHAGAHTLSMKLTG